MALALAPSCGGAPGFDAPSATSPRSALRAPAPALEPRPAAASGAPATAPDSTEPAKESTREQLALGLRYAQGDGVDKDPAKAVEYFRKAAERGDAAAQTLLGAAYRNGEGAPVDPAEALLWLTKAAAQGEPRAEYLLGLVYQNGEGVEKDDRASIEWLRKAALHAYADAQFELALANERGRGTTKNEAEAAKWYDSAAKQGHAAAMNNLGWLYVEGAGVERNEREAVRWFEAADEHGSVFGAGSLGLAYDYGAGGLAPDVQKAISLYEKDGGEWAVKRRDRLIERAQCEPRADTVFFDVKLKCGDRNYLRFKIKAAGGVAQRENDNEWGDRYDTSSVLSGSTQLYVGYTFDNWFAVAEYQFSGDAIVEVGTRILSKYGKPKKTRGNVDLGPASITWIMRDGVEIEVHRDWPPEATYLTYRHPARYRQMKAEQAKLQRKKELERYESESNAF